ncbi:MAG TPA: hypothetical protein VNU25_03490 [Candidatus Paceibacterota bacterium]|nr:hypothetical protein [Candidatus Paceibacterota bacterium]
MYSSELKRLYELGVARQAAKAGMWFGIACGCIALFGYTQGLFEGGVVERNPFGAFMIGYVVGAFVGWMGIWGSHQDESFEDRERGLDDLMERFGENPEDMHAERARLKDEARKWNAIAWPFVLLRRLLLALRPVRGELPS